MYTLSAAIPYILLMLSLAFLPLICPKIWHKFEKIILLAIAVFTILVIISIEKNASVNTLTHVLTAEYIPFMAIIFALYTVSSGIYLELNMADSLKNNVLLLLAGAILANFIGTTGASMLLIRPFLKLNHNRAYKNHLAVFFIFLVANIGGCLTPLGDPPLFLGYLMGVDFFWITKHALIPFSLTYFFCLTIFIIIDRFKNRFTFSHYNNASIKIQGKRNILLILLVVSLTIWAPSLPKDDLVTLCNQHISIQQVVRDIGYVLIGLASIAITPKKIHKLQHFNFGPVNEIARIFLVIFLSLIPISAMLAMGEEGPFKVLFSFANPNGVASEIRYFWMTGTLSAFLDNAPTYLLFFKMAGNDAQILMQNTPLLLAISLGSVFMGALTYIGNAPNIIVRNIAKQNDFPMPSFLGYMAWAFLILIPIFILISLMLRVSLK
jgi:Na+/H+ antiporter NhaD/arsenite permease-like protein